MARSVIVAEMRIGWPLPNGVVWPVSRPVFWGESIFEQRKHEILTIAPNMARSSDGGWNESWVTSPNGVFDMCLDGFLRRFRIWTRNLHKLTCSPCYRQINLEHRERVGSPPPNDMNHISSGPIWWADSGSEEGIFISGLSLLLQMFWYSNPRIRLTQSDTTYVGLYVFWVQILRRFWIWNQNHQ